MKKTEPMSNGEDSMETLRVSSSDTVEKFATTEDLKDQELSAKDEETAPNDLSHHSNVVNSSRDSPLGPLDNNLDHGHAHPPNIYAPQTHPFVYGAWYRNTTGDWEECRPHIYHFEGVETEPTDIYRDGQSVMFHAGFWDNSHVPYVPYLPVRTPLPAAGGDGQLYFTQNFHFTVPYYRQVSPSNMPYLHTPNPMSQTDLTIAFQQQDCLKFAYGTSSLPPFLLPAASPQLIGAVGSFGEGNIPFFDVQQRPFYGFESSSNSGDRGNFDGRIYHHNGNFGESIPSSGNFDHNLQNEQNRGPRATRQMCAKIDQGLATESKHRNTSPLRKNRNTSGVNRALYNKPDFAIAYNDAKFFVIKSCSEENVHKSIKYGVWASTVHGNNKLDAAYRESKEKEDSCPVFLFFSVNASARFCGVAQMVGPVDFDNRVDYWQKDRWNGQFPVKWHIVKDVPNSLFRHITVNGNKPVTDSRDTQEISLEQGLKMLRIMKTHVSDWSILNDFEFYDDKEKALQERKACKLQQKQQHQQQSSSSARSFSVVGDVGTSLPSTSAELVNQITNSFAQEVQLKNHNGEDIASDRSNTSIAKSEGL